MKSKQSLTSRRMKKDFKKRTKRRRILVSLSIIIGILVVAGGVYANNILNTAEKAISDAYEDSDREQSNLRELPVNPKHDHVSILFIGVDSSDHREKSRGNALSDALILATLNKDNNSVKLLSIPRDSYVYIPERDRYDKINHAHAYGGAVATMETLEELLDIPVDYFVRLNFNAFVDVVDALGGIEFDVPYEFKESDSGDVRDAIHLYPGKQMLNGEEALAVARTRKLDNDIMRGKRQQQIMEAIFKRALSFNSINKVTDVIEAVGDNMGTNLLFEDILSLSMYALKGGLDLDMLNLDGADMMLNGIYYYDLDDASLEEVKQTLKSQLDLNDYVLD